ncbi:MAG TPA: TetR/AcrR family transcriptional regulator [Longimicrobium sp.]|jgi:AcrR family transcriptional regulator
MAPRARKATDEDVFCAVIQAISRLGPQRMTLGDVAREVGVTAGALVQRFGSKRDLLLAAIRHYNVTPGEHFTGFRTAHRSPLDALFGYGAHAARAFGTPEELANQLAMLQLDVTDPDFRAEAVRFFQAERELFRGWLREAVEAGELAPEADPERLAAAIQSMFNGGRFLWVLLEDRTPEDAARQELETLLAPYRRAPSRPR